MVVVVCCFCSNGDLLRRNIDKLIKFCFALVKISLIILKYKIAILCFYSGYPLWCIAVPLCNITLHLCRYNCGHVHVTVGYVQCGCQQLQLVHVVCWLVEGTNTSGGFMGRHM